MRSGEPNLLVTQLKDGQMAVELRGVDMYKLTTGEGSRRRREGCQRQ
jgi:hypothetical protein